MNLIGDIRGNISFLRSYIDRNTNQTPTIILGDVGWGFSKDVDNCEFPSWLKGIRGNHDDPNIASTHGMYLGDYGYLEEHELFYISGASSVDKEWRQQYHLNNPNKPKIWWDDEELCQADLYAAADLFRMTRPKIVISHEAPFFCHPILKSVAELNDPSVEAFGPVKRTRTSTTLEEMYKIHQPQAWYFGHWHCSVQFTRYLTTFRCLNIQEVTSI